MDYMNLNFLRHTVFINISIKSQDIKAEYFQREWVFKNVFTRLPFTMTLDPSFQKSLLCSSYRRSSVTKTSAPSLPLKSPTEMTSRQKKIPLTV